MFYCLSYYLTMARKATCSKGIFPVVGAPTLKPGTLVPRVAISHLCLPAHGKNMFKRLLKHIYRLGIIHTNCKSCNLSQDRCFLVWCMLGRWNQGILNNLMASWKMLSGIASQVRPHTYITFRCPYFLPLAALHLEHAVSEYLLSTYMQYNVIGTPEGIHVNMTILGLSHHSYKDSWRQKRNNIWYV